MATQIHDVEKAIREYLSGVLHMSLATCIDNKPWVCEVHYTYDDDLNLYFWSLKSRRHSKEIAQNPNVAGNIIEQHGIKDKPRGVYFEGKAELLEKVEADNPAFTTYAKRFGATLEDLADANTDDHHKFYKITVSKYYLFDVRESNPSQKYELEWNGGKK